MARLAVIAVHGVADQKPGETARDTAALLACGARSGQPAQAAGVEQVVIPVDGTIPRPNSVTPPPDVAWSVRLASRFRPRHPDTRYETSRYGFAPSPANADASVDVYELYWADLSRLAPGAWRILRELWQILFHLALLGQRTLESAVALTPQGSIPAWPRRCLEAAARIARWSFLTLAVPIFFLNLALLMVFLTASAALIPFDWALDGAPLALLVAFLAASGVVSYSRREPKSPGLILAGVVAAGVALVLAGLLFAGALTPQATLLVLALVVFAVLAGLVVEAFSEGRREWLGWGIAIVGGVGLVLLAAILETTRPPVVAGRFLSAAIVAGAQATEKIVVVMLMFWLAKVLLDAAFGVLAGLFMCVRRDGAAGEALRRARTALRTAALGSMLSTAGFVILSLTFWSVILMVQRQGAGLAPAPYTPMKGAPWAASVEGVPTIDAMHMFERMLVGSSGYFVPAVALSLLLLGVLLWAILPSLAVELSPPDKPGEAGAKAQHRLGRWLTTNLGQVAFGVAAAYFAFVLLCAVYFVSFVLFRLPGPDSDVALEIGKVIAGATVGLVALGQRLDDTLGRLRLALDVLLDVDNYMREHPSDGNPRSRIYARLHGLVEFVSAQRYDAIVFVAHSQGTVIVADYLRLRAASGMTGSGWQYLSFGSPLRQLYAAHFPHWYRWVEEDGDPRELLDSMGLDRWVNLYGAGDYVGRRVFAANDASDHFGAIDAATLRASVRASPAVDACAGPLAHTHYVDGSAPLVAVALGELVELAATRK